MIYMVYFSLCLLVISLASRLSGRVRRVNCPCEQNHRVYIGNIYELYIHLITYIYVSI